MFIASHPTGNALSRHLVRALFENDLLFEFWTSLNPSPTSPWQKVLPPPLKRVLSKRALDPAFHELVHTAPWREIVRNVAPHVGLGRIAGYEHGWASAMAVYADIDRRVAGRIEKCEEITAVYGYEDASIHSFQAARKRGVKTYHEVVIGYWRAAKQILGEEAELSPEWASTIILLDSPPARQAQKDEEIGLADEILVASEFTRKTLELCPNIQAPVRIVPYGAPERIVDESQLNLSPRGNRKLRVLYVGGLDQRKGISYLFESVAGMEAHVELTLIGSRTTSDCAALETALAKHTYLDSLPHPEVLEAMRAADVLVFPSLFEGFGMVLTEALSQGLPSITTLHSAGPDILSEGVDGFIVPIRSSTAIREKLELLLSDAERLPAMKLAAREKARSMTWRGYREKLVEVLREK